MNKTLNTIYMYVIGALIVIGFFVCLIYLMFNNKDNIFTSTIQTMIETIKNCLLIIVGFYWGTSMGSQVKTQIMSDQLNKTP